MKQKELAKTCMMISNRTKKYFYPLEVVGRGQYEIKIKLFFCCSQSITDTTTAGERGGRTTYTVPDGDTMHHVHKGPEEMTPSRVSQSISSLSGYASLPVVSLTGVHYTDDTNDAGLASPQADPLIRAQSKVADRVLQESPALTSIKLSTDRRAKIPTNLRLLSKSPRKTKLHIPAFDLWSATRKRLKDSTLHNNRTRNKP